MAIGSHIIVPGTTFGSEMAQCISEGNQFLDLARRLKAQADKYTAGGATPANLENAAVGFAAGDGATVYTDLANLFITINVQTVTDILAKYGG